MSTEVVVPDIRSAQSEFDRVQDIVASGSELLQYGLILECCENLRFWRIMDGTARTRASR